MRFFKPGFITRPAIVAAGGGAGMTIMQMLTQLGLTSSLAFVWDAGDSNSYNTNSPQAWYDVSGNSCHLFFGNDAGAASNDPVFSGVVGARTNSEFMKLNDDAFKMMAEQTQFRSWHTNSGEATMIFFVQHTNVNTAGNAINRNILFKTAGDDGSNPQMVTMYLHPWGVQYQAIRNSGIVGRMATYSADHDSSRLNFFAISLKNDSLAASYGRVNSAQGQMVVTSVGNLSTNQISRPGWLGRLDGTDTYYMRSGFIAGGVGIHGQVNTVDMAAFYMLAKDRFLTP